MTVFRAVGFAWNGWNSPERLKPAVLGAAVPTPTDAHPDADLIELGRELDEAVAEAVRLRDEFCRIENEFVSRKPKPPAELCRPRVALEPYVLTVADCRAAIEGWLDDPENARLLQIAEAHDAAVQALRDGLGLDAAEQAADEASDWVDVIAEEIAEAEARTLDGLAVKVRAVKWGNSQWWNAKTGEPNAGYWADQAAAEILDAVVTLAAMQHVAIAGEA